MSSGASTRLSVVHRTTYQYGLPMADGYTVAYLLARDTPQQHVVSTSIEVEPTPDELEEHVDVFGNRVSRIGMHHRHEHLVVTGSTVVEVTPPDLDLLASSTISWDDAAPRIWTLRGDAAIEVGPFGACTVATPPLRVLANLVGDLFVPGKRLVDLVRDVSARIHRDFWFDPSFSDVSTPLTAVIDARRGVCQDFAHLMIACLRSYGLAARYVSGYIETDPPDGEPKLVGSDASHAWCSVWIPDLGPSGGWLDADPTNDQVPPTRHVTAAWGRDYADVTPVRGVVIGPAAAQTLDVGVDVTAI